MLSIENDTRRRTAANFAKTSSEDAFTEFVKRYVNLVYSAALRQVNGDAPGQFQNEIEWEKIRLALDDAMHELKESDRDAILLRYFENRQFAEVGEKLGLNENAARMRVERALEKLRAIFAKRGITTATTFASAISANAIQTAPANLIATIATTSIATAGTGTFTLLKIMTATKMKLTLSAIIVAGMTTAFLRQQQTQNKLLRENKSLQQQIARSQKDNEKFSNRFTEITNIKNLSDDQFQELLKLRGEVGVLRRQIELQKAQVVQNEPAKKTPRFAGHKPGAYLSKDQLSNSGYATPETALETITWAMMNGTYDQVNQGLPPEMLAEELKDPKGRVNFENQQEKMAALFKGMQIIAEKTLTEDKVELKIKMDADPIPDQTHQPSTFLVQPMVKIENQWKPGGSTREYQDHWGNNGQVQTFVP